MKPPSRKGIKHSEETKRKISESLKGSKNPFFKKEMPWSKKSISEARKVSLSKINKGDKNPNWKGGIKDERKKLRTGRDYFMWRKLVLIRDNFTCQKTGNSGGNLVVHHINNFAEFPELRHSVDNGIVLSNQAHLDFHNKYGRTNNTREQLEEFLNT